MGKETTNKCLCPAPSTNKTLKENVQKIYLKLELMANQIGISIDLMYFDFIGIGQYIGQYQSNPSSDPLSHKLERTF